MFYSRGRKVAMADAVFRMLQFGVLTAVLVDLVLLGLVLFAVWRWVG